MTVTMLPANFLSADFLKETTLFAEIAQSAIQNEFLPHSQIREFEKGQYVLLPDEQLDYFGIVLSGQLHVIHLFDDGSSWISDNLEPGDMYGSDLVFTKTRLSPYHIAAVTDVRMITFPAQLLLHKDALTENTRYLITKNLLHLVSRDNMRREHHRTILFHRGLRERIWTYLTQQARRKGTNAFTISFSREELASYLCVNRSALSHELSSMQQEGWLTFHKNTFTLLK